VITAALAPPVLVAAMLVLPRLHTRTTSVDNPFDFGSFSGPLLAVSRVALAVALMTVLTGVGSLVGRLRHAQGVEHQQLRWVTLAAGATAVGIIAVAAYAITGSVAMIGWAASLTVVLVPPTLGASILRYRLYDVDRILSRVAAYGALSVTLVIIYTTAVVVSAQVLGERSSVAVAFATLLVAAVFQPFRRFIQTTIDRRFDRRRYDAEATVRGFTAMLRDELDPSVVRSTLAAAVNDTMQPTRVTVWLRDRGG
jgi:hypothetical protein